MFHPPLFNTIVIFPEFLKTSQRFEVKTLSKYKHVASLRICERLQG